MIPVYSKTYELSHMFLFYAIGYLKYLIYRHSLPMIDDMQPLTNHAVEFIQTIS